MKKRDSGVSLFLRAVYYYEGVASATGGFMNNTDFATQQQPAYETLQANMPGPGLSPRYRFVSTREIIAELQRAGFAPAHYQEQRVTSAARRGFQKHIVRLRRSKEPVRVRDSVAEIIVINSHDGSAALSLSAGIFRLVCSNGLMASVATIPEIRIVHREYSVARLQWGVERIAQQLPELEEKAETWQTMALPDAQMLEFAEAAVALRWPEVEKRPQVHLEELLIPKRDEDALDSLWNVYNRLQERIIRGGFEARFAGRKTMSLVRPVTGLDRTIELNRALWDTAMKFQQN